MKGDAIGEMRVARDLTRETDDRTSIDSVHMTGPGVQGEKSQ